MKKKTILILSLIVLFVLLAFGGIAGYWGYTLMKKPVLHKDIWVYIDEDTNSSDIYKQLELGEMSLEELGYVQIAEKIYKKKEGGALENNHGAYHLESGLTAAKIVTRILRHQQSPIKMTFNEARLVSDLAGKMSSKLMTDSISMLKAILDPEFIKECDTDSANVIGFFLPDTYEVYWDITPEKFVRRMLSEYKKFWSDERIAKAEALGITPKQATIICSIAEEETQNRAERGVVARLYLNRLNIGMPLQADPTVKFAVGDFTIRRVLNSHLEKDSPYNTYKVAGLPPGPIRIVEKSTINSLLDSKPHNYLYMCAKEDFSGTHNFATNLSAHLQNAARYHAALDKYLKNKK